MRLLVVGEVYFCLRIFFADVIGNMVGRIDRPVLATGTTKVDLEILKTAFQIIFDIN